MKKLPPPRLVLKFGDDASIDLGPITLKPPPPLKKSGPLKEAHPHRANDCLKHDRELTPAPIKLKTPPPRRVKSDAGTVDRFNRETIDPNWKDPNALVWPYLDKLKLYEGKEIEQRIVAKVRYEQMFGEELPERIPNEVIINFMGYELARRGHAEAGVPMPANLSSRWHKWRGFLTLHWPKKADSLGFTFRNGQALKAPPPRKPSPQKMAPPKKTPPKKLPPRRAN